MRARELLLAVVAAIGLVGTGYYNARYIGGGGGVFDLSGFARLAFVNDISSTLTIDAFVAWLAFTIWAPLESRRLGMRFGWAYPVIGLLVALAFAFPLYLLLRERHLRRGATT